MKPHFEDAQITLYHGDCREVLSALAPQGVRTVVTSPPYFGLREYGGGAREIGQEATAQAYIAALVAVFRDVRRVLKDDGTLWLNLGDAYGGGTKQLLGVPWRVALALQDDGWYLRSDVVWSKPNVKPESVRDRPSRNHEYLFLLSKRPRYYYDADAVREESTPSAQNLRRAKAGYVKTGRSEKDGLKSTAGYAYGAGRNRRTVWTVATRPFRGAHFAIFPPELVEPCVLAGSQPGDTVLDPFCGTGTAGHVAQRLGRRFVGIDVSAEYLGMAQERLGVSETLTVWQRRAGKPPARATQTRLLLTSEGGG